MDDDLARLRELSGEDDVPTLVGLMGAPLPSGYTLYPVALADYKLIVSEKTRQEYDVGWERTWTSDLVTAGVEIGRIAPNFIRITSRARTFTSELQLEDVPVFYIDLEGSEKSLDSFYSKMEELGYWVFHVRTTLHSYIWIMTKDGQVIHKVRMDKPLEFIEKEG